MRHAEKSPDYLAILFILTTFAPSKTTTE